MKKIDIFPIVVALGMLVVCAMDFMSFRFGYPIECAAVAWIILNHQKEKKSVHKLLLLSLIIFFLTIFIAEIWES